MPPGRISVRGLRPLLVALGLFALSPDAGAVVVRPCGPVSAAARPGPIEAGQAAIRLVTPGAPGPVDPSEVSLFDAMEREQIPEVEHLEDGSSFLRFTDDLDLGAYRLEYRPACGDPFELSLTVSEAPPEVTSLGELALQHAARCPGVAGVVELRVALSESAAPYQRFLALEVSDDLGTVWTEGVLPSELFANPISLRGWSDCSDPGTILVLGPPVAPGLRTFLATASVVDGAVLQTISGELDVACPYCPITGIPTPVDAGTPSGTGSCGSYSPCPAG
jgi:hypothetical protein